MQNFLKNLKEFVSLQSKWEFRILVLCGTLIGGGMLMLLWVIFKDGINC